MPNNYFLIPLSLYPAPNKYFLRRTVISQNKSQLVIQINAFFFWSRGQTELAHHISENKVRGPIIHNTSSICINKIQNISHVAAHSCKCISAPIPFPEHMDHSDLELSEYLQSLRRGRYDLLEPHVEVMRLITTLASNSTTYL